MYLTIGLIMPVPIGAQLYHRMTLYRTQQMLCEQVGQHNGPDHRS